MISDKAHIDPSAKIGENVTIHPFAYIDKDVVIGDNTVVMPFASIIRGSRIGKNCKVFQGAIVGADPAGLPLERRIHILLHRRQRGNPRERHH